MQIIGLCGQSGSGKSTAAEIFCSLGAKILDADKIYRELTDAPGACLDAIIDAFGVQALDAHGKLNRAYLRSVVFSGAGAEDRRVLLNSITHKFVKEEMERRIDALKREGAAVVLLDVPLLFESGIDKLCDFLICVTADEKTRLERIVMRDGITADQALMRIRAQASDEALIRQTHFHIQNSSDKISLEHQVKSIYKKIMEKVGL